MTIRIAIVGLGKIARDQHIPVLRAHRKFTIAAFVSRHSVIDGAPTFKSLEALLASDVEIDAVALCQPPQARFDAARHTLEAGKHVFLEKPPGATLSEVEALIGVARERRVTLFASWHSRYASGVAPARAWLSGKTIKSVSIVWKEDVRVWHPGQEWLWQPGGFGVFDPGINALSIATTILPHPFFLTSARLSVPANKDAPIAAELDFRDTLGNPIHASFDFLKMGPQIWEIRVDTSDGLLILFDGGGALRIDGVDQALAPNAEYAALYDRFSALIAEGASDVDLSPLRHVADAFLLGARRQVAPFVD